MREKKEGRNSKSPKLLPQASKALPVLPNQSAGPVLIDGSRCGQLAEARGRVLVNMALELPFSPDWPFLLAGAPLGHPRDTF